jgi:phosphoribosylformylglycinamidine cyclo-ligase
MTNSYKKAGVNIDTANKTKVEIAKSLNSKDKRFLNKIGAFAALIDPNFKSFKRPILVFKTEEPGSKQKLAFQYNKIGSIAYDLVNHLINDILVMGATPLCVQDCIVCGKINKKIVLQIVTSMSEACLKNNCVLTGGETSEQPLVLGKDTYILSASVIGLVEKSKIIDGSKIKKGDRVIAISSNGIHTNGYSLIRKLITKKPSILRKKVYGKSFIDVILKPHLSYYNALKDINQNSAVVGLAHITGGGIEGNLNRVLPRKLNANIHLDKIRILDIFQIIKRHGNISDKEMLRTFNLGVGLTLIVKENKVNFVINKLKKHNFYSYIIGEITNGNKQVRLLNKLNWKETFSN